jgi:hypothetical protein
MPRSEKSSRMGAAVPGPAPLCRVCSRSNETPGTTFPQLNAKLFPSVPGVPDKTVLTVHGKKHEKFYTADAVRAAMAFLLAHRHRTHRRPCKFLALISANAAVPACAGSLVDPEQDLAQRGGGAR